MNRRTLLVIAVAVLLSGCVSGVPVSIANQSSSDLTNVVVSGKGFSESVGTIRAGGSAIVRVRPKGESGVKVAFEVNGQRYFATDPDFIENDNVNTVEATVDADFSIVIKTSVR
jgi:hypothetical protein